MYLFIYYNMFCFFLFVIIAYNEVVFLRGALLGVLEQLVGLELHFGHVALQVVLKRVRLGVIARAHIRQNVGRERLAELVGLDGLAVRGVGHKENAVDAQARLRIAHLDLVQVPLLVAHHRLAQLPLPQRRIGRLCLLIADAGAGAGAGTGLVALFAEEKLEAGLLKVDAEVVSVEQLGVGGAQQVLLARLLGAQLLAQPEAQLELVAELAIGGGQVDTMSILRPLRERVALGHLLANAFAHRLQLVDSHLLLIAANHRLLATAAAAAAAVGGGGGQVEVGVEDVGRFEHTSFCSVLVVAYVTLVHDRHVGVDRLDEAARARLGHVQLVVVRRTGGLAIDRKERGQHLTLLATEHIHLLWQTFVLVLQM